MNRSVERLQWGDRFIAQHPVVTFVGLLALAAFIFLYAGHGQWFWFVALGLGINVFTVWNCRRRVQRRSEPN